MIINESQAFRGVVVNTAVIWCVDACGLSVAHASPMLAIAGGLLMSLIAFAGSFTMGYLGALGR